MTDSRMVLDINILPGGPASQVFVGALIEQLLY